MKRQPRRTGPLLLLSIAIPVSVLGGPTATPDFTFTPTVLTFRYQIGAALPAAQTIQVKSSGAAFGFTAAVSGPAPYNAKWLSLSVNSGATPASPKVYVNPTGLPAGSYSGTITFTSSGAGNSPKTIPVTLIVGDAPASLAASPGTLTFDWTSGQALPAAQSVVLSSNGVPLSAAITITGASWLKAQPSGNIALVGLPGTVLVSVDPASLVPGTYSGKMTFTSTTAANKTATVSVTLNVNAGLPTVSAVWPAGIAVGSPATTITLTGTNFFSTTTASIGALALTSTYISSTTLLAVIPPSSLASAGNLSVTATTPAPGGGTSTAQTFTVYPPGPQVLAVGNVASYDTSAISPGEIITIYGTGLGPATLTLFQPSGGGAIAATLPASGAATSISIDGSPAPILYTSSNQLSCIVPYAVAAKAGQNVNIVVTYNSVASSNFPIAAAAVHPGIFTLDASGLGQGAILNVTSSGDYVINGSGNTAAKGSIVVLYVTGFGQTNPVGQEDQLIAGTVAPTAAVTVTIGGQTAAVQAAQCPLGSVPGVVQINATVPSTVAGGNAVPVVVSIGSSASQTGVTMAIK